jgi:hypothetical protein
LNGGVIIDREYGIRTNFSINKNGGNQNDNHGEGGSITKLRGTNSFITIPVKIIEIRNGWV